MAEEKTSGFASESDALAAFIELERRARQASSERALFFVLANETPRLLPATQTVVWRLVGRAGKVEAISGAEEVARDAPYPQWLAALVSSRLKRDAGPQAALLTADDFPPALGRGFQEWAPGNLLWCPLVTPSGHFMGGLMLLREKPWHPAEVAVAGRLMEAYAHAWQGLLGSRKPMPQGRRLGRWGVVAGALLLLLLVPVRLSILAPGQIAPQNPLVVGAPVEGVIKAFHVQPNQPVQAGDLLFSLDDTDFRNRLAVAEKSLEVARAQFREAGQRAFVDEEGKAQSQSLKARILQKEAEAAWYSELLARVEVKAPAPGLAIFSDVNDWLGRPLKVGQKVLTIADPMRVELTMELPVESIIPLPPKAPVRFFLDSDPLHPLAASLQWAAYEPAITPEGVLAFRAIASLEEDGPRPRVGLRGTAKIHGEHVTLLYYLLRRPLSALRRMTGM